MTQRHLILATLVCTLFAAALSAQEQVSQETFAPASVNSAQDPVSSTTTAARAQGKPVRTRGPYFYSSAQRHPLTPRDVSMREAVESLGIDKHRFVLCELKDGSHFVGGISDFKFGYFRISKGIMNSREIRYSELKQVPQHIPAVGEHLVNGLEWTGLVAACVVFSPLVIVFYPLVLAGVISD
jgi:hypothetical protein